MEKIKQFNKKLDKLKQIGENCFDILKMMQCKN